MFPYVPLKVISEVIKSFLCIELNTEATFQYLRDKNIIISKREINNIYKAMRIYIQKYLLVVYNSENISKKNNFKNFAVDESLFGHRNNKQLWLLGAINTETQVFRIEPTYERTTENIKKFIGAYINTGNYIITDGFPSYDYLDQPGSGYIRLRNLHNEENSV